MRHTTLHDWLTWQESLHPNAIDLGLDRVREVAQRMTLLQPSFAIVTVGGTNGKGSTVAMTESILRAAGYRVGAYTSPHLLRYNERVRVDGIEMGDEVLVDAFARVDAARGETSLTYFEFGTLAAMDIFTRAAPDVVVLEVGLGGRLDAVNVWDADVSVVSSVALDHMEWLGADRESIAFEKAGIYRAGRPAIFGEANVPQRLREHAQHIDAPLLCYGTDFGVRVTPNGWTWWGPGGERHALVVPALRGAHQLQNAAGVLMAIEALRSRPPLTLPSPARGEGIQLMVTTAQIREGLGQVRLTGRFEVVPGPVNMILDVAHNPHGAHALAHTLRSQPCTGRTFAVCGMLGDKDIAATLAELTSVVDAWWVAPVASARSASAEQIEQAARKVVAGQPLAICEDIAQALGLAQAAAHAGDRIVVFGSFYTVAAALHNLPHVTAGVSR